MRTVRTDGVPIKLWLDDLEEGALRQAQNLALLPFVHRWVALMPDSHQGYGMPIGGVLATDGVVIPNAVGVDIGCGMAAARTDLRGIDPGTLGEVMGRVKAAIPMGFSHHREAQAWEGFDRVPDLPVFRRELASARRQLGTLGGGNHFIEFQLDEEGGLWVMLHSGSRNLGLQVAGEYHRLAQGSCARRKASLPDRDLAWLSVDEAAGRDYLAAMAFCLEFARASRAHMLAVVLRLLGEATGARALERRDIHHNYAALEEHQGRRVWVHRKGATRARRGEQGLIPGSMGSSSYVVEGLGNPESFESCSHGAGRRMGRKEAGRKLDLAAEQARMAGILHGLRSPRDLDEAPGAYKDIDRVMAQQQDLVRILVRLRPVGSLKG